MLLFVALGIVVECSAGFGFLAVGMGLSVLLLLEFLNEQLLLLVVVLESSLALARCLCHQRTRGGHLPSHRFLGAGLDHVVVERESVHPQGHHDGCYLRHPSKTSDPVGQAPIVRIHRPV